MPPTVIQNTHRQWHNDVAEEVTDPTTGAKVKQAFFEGKAVKELVKPNWPIYKFNDYPTLAAGPEPWRTLSPWWSPYEEHHHDGGWEARVRFAEHLGVSIREMGRLTSVIKEGWNSLGYLLVIRLKQPAWGFWGTFKGMDREAGPGSKMFTNENRPRNAPADFRPELKGASRGLTGSGGASQFYIPGLRVMHVSSWTVTSLLNK
jgi:hypothetical protein